MIDIHAHILPGLDDGARDTETALAMAEMAGESGVRTIIATPHCNLPGNRPNFADETLQRTFFAFCRSIHNANIPVNILLGMEIFGTPEVPELLRTGKLIPLAGSRCPLIEFPFRDYGQQATEILAGVAALGFRPIVAHPERYYYVQQSPELLNRWIELGCLLQVNKGSLLGRFGPAEEATALELLDRGFVSFVASDAHSPIVRTPWMADVQDLIADEYSPKLARRLLEDNPQTLLEGRDVETAEPEWF